jgi:hypothetical protein
MEVVPRKILQRWFVVLAIAFCLDAHADCTVTNLGLIPFPDLGGGFYKGVAGGLYPNGMNARPAEHEAAGLQIALDQVQPRDTNGTVNATNGRIVLLSIGMSNTTQEWGGGFQPLANADPAKNPRLVLVDGAQGGQAATDWTSFNSLTWTNIQNRLRNAGVSTNQVQIIWMKHARRNPTQPFPLHAQLLQTNLEEILRVAQQRYPNLKIAYLSSRTRSYATNVGGLNPEPFAYESALSVRGLIEKQLNGNLNYTPANGPVVVPWLSWGPYLWADGTNPRSDRFAWLCSDLQNDFTHPSPGGGVPKVGAQLLAFFKTDVTTTPWFLKKTVIGQPPVCTPTANVTNGPAPLVVNFTANATDPDGSIRDYQWTFEDGTFSTNANPVKSFPAPGAYRARLTVTDNQGNTALGMVNVNATTSGAMLGSPAHAANQFQFSVTGATNLNHVIQASSNLMNWVPLQTNRGPFTFVDPEAATFPSRFYRAVSTP